MLFSPFALRQAVAGQYARARDPAVVHLLHHMCQAASDLNVTTTDVTDGFLAELMPMLKEDRAAAVEAILQVGDLGVGWDGGVPVVLVVHWVGDGGFTVNGFEASYLFYHISPHTHAHGMLKSMILHIRIVQAVFLKQIPHISLLDS